MLQPLYPKGKCLQYQLNWRLSGPPWAVCTFYRKDQLLETVIIHRHDHPANSPVATHWQYYPSSLKYWKDLLIFPEDSFTYNLNSSYCKCGYVHKWVQIKLPQINVVYGKLYWIMHHNFATESVIFLFSMVEDMNTESCKLRE